MKNALFALLVLAPASLLAQGPQPQRFELTPVVGYRLNSDFDAVSGDFFDANVDIEESATYGLLFDIPLGESGWKLELLANRQESTLIVDEGILDPTLELGDLSLGIYHVGLLYQWGPGQVEPFIAFAGGLTHIAPDFPGVKADNRLSGSLGGGVKVFFTDNVGLRLEGRGYWTDLSDDNNNDRRFESEDALFQGEASAGLILAW
jgi:hypothetical protein